MKQSIPLVYSVLDAVIPSKINAIFFSRKSIVFNISKD
jgi:hypothetical protein